MTMPSIDQQLATLLIKGALFSVVVAVAGQLLKHRTSARYESIFWRAAMIGLLIVPAAFAFIPHVSLRSSQSQEASALTTETINADWRAEIVNINNPDKKYDPGSPLTTATTATTPTPPTNWLIWIWLAGFCSLYFRRVFASLLLRRIVRSSQNPPPPLSELISNLLPSRTRPVAFRISPQFKVPMVVGVFRPTILLPCESLSWNGNVTRSVIAHELEHANRWDGLFLLISQMVTAFYFPNPLVWWISRNLRIADERCADDHVLETGQDPQSYAELLLCFAKQNSHSELFPALASSAMAYRSKVLYRIDRILDSKQTRKAPRLSVWISSSFAVLALSLLFGAITTQQVVAQENSGTPTLEESKTLDEICRSLVIPRIELKDATFVQAVLFLSRESRRIDPLKKGVHFALKTPSDNSEPRITLDLENVALSKAVIQVAEMAKVNFEIAEKGILFTGTKAPLPSGLMTKVYPVSPDFFEQLKQLTKDPNDDPFAPTPQLSDVLQKAGVKFGENASVTFDESVSAVTLKNTGEYHRKFDVLLRAITIAKAPNVVRLRLELYEMSKAEALRISVLADSGNSGEAALEATRKLLGNGSATLLASPALMTGSGQRAKLESGYPVSWIAGYREENGEDFPIRKETFRGIVVECDPVLNPDKTTLNIAVSINTSRGEPIITKKTVVGPASGANREIEDVSLVQQSLTSNLTTISGQTQLIGNLLSESADSPKAVLAFITATVTKAIED